MRQVSYGTFTPRRFLTTQPLNPKPKVQKAWRKPVPIKTVAVESSVDANPNGEWIIEFTSCQHSDDGDDNHWRRCLDEPWKLDFDPATQVLCALVRTNTLVVYNDNIPDDSRVPRDRALVASERFDARRGRVFTLQFDPGTHYRARNITTGEIIHGDAL